MGKTIVEHNEIWDRALKKANTALLVINQISKEMLADKDLLPPARLECYMLFMGHIAAKVDMVSEIIQQNKGGDLFPGLREQLLAEYKEQWENENSKRDTETDRQNRGADQKKP